jgi:succinyl-CoA synthetase beta subunit
MNIHEYQAKKLLAQYGVAVPGGEAVRTPAEAKAVAEKLFAAGQKMVVVKSQIHAGGEEAGARARSRAVSRAA